MTEASPPGMRRLPLFAERYVLIGRAGHPKLKRRPTLAQFGTLEHVIVSPDGGFFGVTDEALAKVGATRRVVLSVPHFLFVLSAVASTDLVAMVPERLVRDVPALRVVAAPSTCPAMKCRCCGTNACIAIRRIGGCGRRSRQRCRSVACPGRPPASIAIARNPSFGA